MNNNSNDRFDLTQSRAAGNAPQAPASESLELFAEELPAQQDLLKVSTTSSASTASTLAGSTASTVSSFSTVSG